jgi:hypothetical protein
MLETVVLCFAAAVALAIFILLFWIARRAQSDFEKRQRQAESGGRRLSIDEWAALETFGRRRPPSLGDPGAPPKPRRSDGGRS